MWHLGVDSHRGVPGEHGPEPAVGEVEKVVTREAGQTLEGVPPLRGAGQDTPRTLLDMCPVLARTHAPFTAIARDVSTEGCGPGSDATQLCRPWNGDRTGTVEG